MRRGVVSITVRQDFTRIDLGMSSYISVDDFASSLKRAGISYLRGMDIREARLTDVLDTQTIDYVAIRDDPDDLDALPF